MSGFYESAWFVDFERAMIGAGWAGDVDSIRLLCRRAKRVDTLNEDYCGRDFGQGRYAALAMERCSARAERLLPRAQELVAGLVAENLPGWVVVFGGDPRGLPVRLFAPGEDTESSMGLGVPISGIG